MPLVHKYAMEIELEITDLSRSGPGVGREASGRVVFVPFAAPGDLLKVEILEEDKRYAESRLVEILRPSPLRIEPKCPVFSKCGGCDWQQLTYEKQWNTKVAGLKHALKRVEIPLDAVEFQEFPAEQVWGYRNRIQLRGFGNEIGFYARNSKHLVPIENCAIARDELNQLIPNIKAEGASRPREYKVELEVFESGKTAVSWNASHSASGFRQVHDEQNKKLRTWVESELKGSQTLLDLYGGSGNLSLGLQGRFLEIHCVDIGTLHKNPDQSKGLFQFHNIGVLPWLKQYKGGKNISVILDPPRDGLGRDLVPILEILKNLDVKEILSIGCESDPWIRSLHRMLRYGWHLEKIGALDFFPQTHHVESLAILRR